MRKRPIEDSSSKRGLEIMRKRQLLLKYVGIIRLTDPRVQLSSYSREKRSTRDGRMMTKNPNLRALSLESRLSALLEMLLLFEIFNLNGLFETPITLRMLCVC